MSLTSMTPVFCCPSGPQAVPRGWSQKDGLQRSPTTARRNRQNLAGWRMVDDDQCGGWYVSIIKYPFLLSETRSFSQITGKNPFLLPLTQFRACNAMYGAIVHTSAMRHLEHHSLKAWHVSFYLIFVGKSGW